MGAHLVHDEGEESVADLDLDAGRVQLVHDVVRVQERKEPGQPEGRRFRGRFLNNFVPGVRAI
jgi:hypothetical protein